MFVVCHSKMVCYSDVSVFQKSVIQIPNEHIWKRKILTLMGRDWTAAWTKFFRNWALKLTKFDTFWAGIHWGRMKDDSQVSNLERKVGFIFLKMESSHQIKTLDVEHLAVRRFLDSMQIKRINDSIQNTQKGCVCEYLFNLKPKTHSYNAFLHIIL